MPNCILHLSLQSGQEPGLRQRLPELTVASSCPVVEALCPALAHAQRPRTSVPSCSFHCQCWTPIPVAQPQLCRQSPEVMVAWLVRLPHRECCWDVQWTAAEGQHSFLMLSQRCFKLFAISVSPGLSCLTQRG